MAYATVADLEAWLGGPAPPDSEVALEAAARLFGNMSQVLPLDEQPDGVLRDASCAQVEFWMETGRTGLDMSHDILRLRGDAMVGSMMVPEYPICAPRAMQVFQTYGNWCPGIRTSGSRGPWFSLRR